MAAEKALALVVRGTDWSETSRIATLFTRECGKVRALAKGGRRLKSNFDCAFDLLSVCRVVYLRKAHGGLDLLTEAQLAERFPALRTDLHALYAGYYIAELLADGTQDYDPHPVLFDTAVEALRGLEAKNPSPNPLPQGERGLRQSGPAPPSFPGKGVGGLGSSNHPSPTPPPRREGLQAPVPAPPSLSGKGVGGLGSDEPLPNPSPKKGGAPDTVGGMGPHLDTIARFELVWLKELGYSPRLDACTACGADVLPRGTARAAFSPAAGGVVCPACAPAAADRRLLSPAALAALRSLTADDARPPPDLAAARAELRGLLGQVVSYVLGRRPRLLGYVEGR